MTGQKTSPIRVIDRTQLLTEGAHFIWVLGGEQEIRIVTMQDQIGQRPWSFKAH